MTSWSPKEDDLLFILAQLTTFFSKYGHFWLQKFKMVTAKIQSRGFKMANQWVPSWMLRPLFIQSMVSCQFKYKSKKKDKLAMV